MSVKRKKTIWQYMWRHRYMYLMLVPVILYYIIFHYGAMYGASIAFKNFNMSLGILDSPWTGLDHFRRLFQMDKFFQVFWNTISISMKRLMFGFPTPIIMALLMNELTSLKFKKAVQTSIYLPHFISWVILGGLLVNLLSIDGGAVNSLVTVIRGQPIRFLTDSNYFVGTLVGSMIWKEFGWTSIIYMAALSGVDPQLYEAATVDGAGRWKQLLHVTLPSIMSTIIVILVLRIGGLMEAGFEQIFVLYHPSVYPVADIIDTYVYRTGLAEGRFSLASAVGLFKSVINFTLLIIANHFARKIGEQGVY